jgi:hypothetical protein
MGVSSTTHPFSRRVPWDQILRMHPHGQTSMFYFRQFHFPWPSSVGQPQRILYHKQKREVTRKKETFTLHPYQIQLCALLYKLSLPGKGSWIPARDFETPYISIAAVSSETSFYRRWYTCPVLLHWEQHAICLEGQVIDGILLGPAIDRSSNSDITPGSRLRQSQSKGREEKATVSGKFGPKSIFISYVKVFKVSTSSISNTNMASQVRFISASSRYPAAALVLW